MSKNPHTHKTGIKANSSDFLASLANFSHVEIKALALVGLVLFDEINKGNLVADVFADYTGTRKLIEAGYRLQDQINGVADDLPEAMRCFAKIAEREVHHD